MTIEKFQETNLIFESQLLFYVPILNKWTLKLTYPPDLKTYINLQICTRYMWGKLQNSENSNKN
jgi:hypothetical protein